jgi:hypothetical protein
MDERALQSSNAMTPKTPVFLARASYRQRRLRDVVRILPFVGFVAWILPTLSGLVPATSSVGLYIFAGWLVLILISAWITSRLTPDAQDATSDVKLDG